MLNPSRATKCVVAFLAAAMLASIPSRTYAEDGSILQAPGYDIKSGLNLTPVMPTGTKLWGVNANGQGAGDTPSGPARLGPETHTLSVSAAAGGTSRRAATTDRRAANGGAPGRGAARCG